jgi:hypothetical protein
VCVIRAPKTPSALSAHLLFTFNLSRPSFPPPLCVQCAQLAASLDEGMLDEIDMVVRNFTEMRTDGATVFSHPR